jgi:uncharacterized protein (DUF983 family)
MARIVSFKRLPWRTRLAAMTAGCCPRCRRGTIFAGRLAMHPTCPACGLRFEREPGYFTGAMYVSYALAVPLVAVCAVLVCLVAPQLSFGATVGTVAVLSLPFVPALFRSSRILWIHLDQTIDPSK